MGYRIVTEVEVAEGTDAVGISSVLSYVLNTSLQGVPGVTSVSITELTAIEEGSTNA